MKQCKFCNGQMGDKEEICHLCGYNFKTDTLTPNFKKNESALQQIKKQRKVCERRPINARVRNFAIFGILVTIIALALNKFQLDASWTKGFKKMFSTAKLVKIISGEGLKAKDEEQKTHYRRYITTASFEGINDPEKYKGILLIEGIAYDPNGKSFVTVNGKVISEGEDCEGVIIQKIHRDFVDVLIGSETRSIRLYESISLSKKGFFK